MVRGVFGVFDGVDCIAEFGDDVSAEEHRDEVLELHIPEGFRCSAYDDLAVREIPEGYDQMRRLRDKLRVSRNQDLTVSSALEILRAAQQERAVRGRATRV
jgi:hypothetical protein